MRTKISILFLLLSGCGSAVHVPAGDAGLPPDDAASALADAALEPDASELADGGAPDAAPLRSLCDFPRGLNGTQPADVACAWMDREVGAVLEACGLGCGWEREIDAALGARCIDRLIDASGCDALAAQLADCECAEEPAL